jgi:predicted Zn-dependent protease
MPPLEEVARRFGEIAPAVEYWSLRVVDERYRALRVRQDVFEPLVEHRSLGAMITVVDGGGHGYAATSELGREGLRRAAARAREWAHRTAAVNLVDPSLLPRATATGSYATPVERPWDSTSLADKIAILRATSHTLRGEGRGASAKQIVDWEAALVRRDTDVLLTSSAGAHIEQALRYVEPSLAVVANEGSNTQRRTHGGMNCARQGGLEQVDDVGLATEAERIADEALALLAAPESPAGTMDLLLMPGQMALQVHESIGHPLELDRILGDERNYAGTSFVTLDMIGSYRYGSELLDVVFDPGVASEVAAYRWDDEGSEAERHHLIRGGILVRPLGGACSQARAGIDGVACARASDWSRPPIDRMANVNVEPGTSSLAELIASVEHGVLMDTNRSWSIDDARNKFQFGCEYGRVIENGTLGHVVRNPGYRGVSATFWRSLAGVGDETTFEVYGPTNCGKGEPNQAIHTGHAAPACLFHDVAVFGGS